MKKTLTLIFAAIFFSNLLAAQNDDLLKLVGDDEPTTDYITNAFKSSRVVNGQSMEMIAKGAMDFRILHRFGKLSGGAYEMFGLDQASMRIGLDYGIYKNLTIGIGRSTAKKELDGFVKFRILQQSKGKRNMPFSLLYVGGITCNTLKWANPDRENFFTSRLGFYHQIIVGRKFNEWFSFQLSPTMVHRNLIEFSDDSNDLYSVGIGTRLKLTKRMAITVDYFPVLNRYSKSETYDALSLGIDIETGGHVFQLHFSNSTGMNERAFIADTKDQWGKGEVRFGFNLSRMFQINK